MGGLLGRLAYCHIRVVLIKSLKLQDPFLKNSCFLYKKYFQDNFDQIVRWLIEAAFKNDHDQLIADLFKHCKVETQIILQT